MSTLSQFINTGGAFTNKLFIVTSRTFTVPPGVNKVRAHAWGAGGSGGNAFFVRGEGVATGGGGGAYSSIVFNTTPGTNITITIGAGAGPNTSSPANGNTGGTTTVTYSGVSISAGGGTGGRVRGATIGGLNGTTAGGLGGTASGGTINIPGGNAHVMVTASYSGNISSCPHIALGGGAAATPIYGTPPNTVVTYTFVTNVTNGPLDAFGGIGVASYSTNAIDINNDATGGGGTEPVNQTTGGACGDIFGGRVAAGANGSYGDIDANFPNTTALVGNGLLNVYGGGGGGSLSTVAGASAVDGGIGGPGGGGGGAAANSGAAMGGTGGLFGGGGARVTANASASEIAGSGGLGGGGGGGAVSPSAGCTAGSGGNGLVILEW